MIPGIHETAKRAEALAVEIQMYLDAAHASGLREVLGRDATLEELAQTPLTLSMMTLAYGG